ncbi:MAG: hypothetical protein OER92_03210, partial [Alphaproteobacteria bacterium]|nr:hypothetical protein [Alphaproteobacteria bacterium]
MKRLLINAILGLVAAAASNIGAVAQTTPNHAPMAPCRESGPLPNQIRCFLDTAEAQGDVRPCEAAYDFAVRFACISKFAE